MHYMVEASHEAARSRRALERPTTWLPKPMDSKTVSNGREEKAEACGVEVNPTVEGAGLWLAQAQIGDAATIEATADAFRCGTAGEHGDSVAEVKLRLGEGELFAETHLSPEDAEQTAALLEEAARRARQKAIVNDEVLEG